MTYEKIKKHWPALVLAVCVGIIILLPTLLSIQKLGDGNFKGIYPVFSDDEDYYLTLQREVYDGHLNLSNPYFKEHKKGSYLFPPIPHLTLAFTAKLFNISIPTLAFICDFLLPFISVLLLYGLLFRMTGKKTPSLFLTALYLFIFISAFNRPVTPQFGFPFLLLGFHLIWTIVMRNFELKKVIKYNLLLSLVFGILVYSYPFYWMTLGIVYTTWTLFIASREKNFSYWSKNWLVFFIPALLFSLPFIINTLKLRSNPLWFETNLRFGFIYTHFPGAFQNILIMVLSLPLAYLLSVLCKDERKRLLGFALILSGVVLNWQNVITGQTLQFPPHFYPIMILFVFLISVTLLSNLELKESSESLKLSLRNIASILIIVIIFGGLLYKQKGEIVHAWKGVTSPQDISNLQKFAPALQWFEKNTPADSAVYVLNDKLNSFVPIYTDNNVYFSANAGFSLMSDDELENRWAIQKFFDDVKENDVGGNRDIWSNKFIDTYQSKESRKKILSLLTGKNYPETILMDQVYIDRVLDKHKKFRNLGFEKALKTYEVDYVILDIKDKNYSHLDGRFKVFSFLEPVANLDNIIIYKVN